VLQNHKASHLHHMICPAVPCRAEPS
jgi:hypothetical protein